MSQFTIELCSVLKIIEKQLYNLLLFCGLTLQEVIDMCDFAVGLSRQLNGSVIPSERELASLLHCFQNSQISNFKQFFAIVISCF